MREADAADKARLLRSRTDAGLVFLDGFHAVKHALRFGAQELTVFCEDPERLRALARRLAPDAAERLESVGVRVPADSVPLRAEERAHGTAVWGVARRPTLPESLPGAGPVVVLESPRHAGNVGAAVRAAAAAGAGAVVVVDGPDPWGAAAVRGAAGTQFALDVFALQHTSELAALLPPDRQVIALSPAGADIREVTVAKDAVFLFGTERAGLTDTALRLADVTVRIPMREGISSLNLAVSVAAALYLTAPSIG